MKVQNTNPNALTQNVKSYLLSIIFTVATIFSFSQTVHTVDNRVQSGAQFTSVQAAIDAANPGDIIQIHPSSTTYGNISIDKTLTLIGMGHTLDANETNDARATLNIINFTSGTTAQNCIIQGLNFSSLQPLGSADTIGLKLLNNRIRVTIFGSGGTNANDWEILGNYFFTNNYGTAISQGTASNWIISNNYFEGSIISSLDQFTVFTNNIVVHRVHNSTMFSSCDNTTVANNLFLFTSTTPTPQVGLSGSTLNFANCLTYDYTGGTIADLPQQMGATNYNNQEPVFENIPTSVTDFYNNDYRLATGSPGEDGGSEGTDIGVFGRNFSFDVNGRPDQTPYPTSIDITNVLVAPGQNLNVLFQASQKQ